MMNSIDTAALLLGPKLKVRRANVHIAALKRSTVPLDSGLYAIETGFSPGTPMQDSAGYHVTYQPKYPIPELLALTIGDAVHNLRAALDHIVGHILRSQTLEWRPYFPMHPDRRQLETDKTLRIMDGVLPGSAELLLTALRPKAGPNDRLWSFNRLDNRDKHSLILPVVSIVAVSGLSALSGFSQIDRCTVVGDAARRTRLIRSDDPIKLLSEPSIITKVMFSNEAHEDNVFAGEAVIPTLDAIASLVSETVASFERLILSGARGVKAD